MPNTAFPSTDVLARALSQHTHALSLRSKEHTKTPDALVSLDAWLLSTLAPKVTIDKADLTSLMKWKLSRGKMRPTLLALIASNTEDAVLEATTEALAAVRAAGEDDVEGALGGIKLACKLRGVGAATASALLTLSPPHLLPFMSDEAASFFAPALGPVKYTDAFYAKFARAMRAEVVRLNAESGVIKWDCMKLERALWAICILRKHGEDAILDFNPAVQSVPT